MSPRDVLVFGEALVDFFPPAPGLALEECTSFVRHAGGAPTNVAITLARLGRSVALVTSVGADPFGRFLVTELAREGVDIRGVGTHPEARTGITFVSVRDDGERSFLFYRHPSADQLVTPADIDARRTLIRDSRVVHLGSSTMAREPGRAATLRLLELARESGALVSFDPNPRPRLWEDFDEARPLVERVLSCSDIVKLSLEELEPILGVSDPMQAFGQIFRRWESPGLVAVTLGEGGAIASTRAGVVMHLPADRIAAVDATGAGDAFVGGMLDAVLSVLGRGLPAENRSALGGITPEELEAILGRGNRMGSQAVTALGATTNVARPGT